MFVWLDDLLCIESPFLWEGEFTAFEVLCRTAGGHEPHCCPPRRAPYPRPCGARPSGAVDEEPWRVFQFQLRRLHNGGIQRGGGIGAVGKGMGSRRSRVALLVAVRDGAGLPVSVPTAAAGGGAIVEGSWRCGNFGCEGGALGRDLLGGGSWGD